MNLNQLHYFYRVAQEGGFLKASKALRIQQPAISRMVRQLEESLNVELFERVGRRVRLTPKGEEVFEHCQRIFGEVEQLEESLSATSQEVKGPLQIVTNGALAAGILPLAIKDLLHTHPKVHPHILTATSERLCQQVLKGESELGLTFHIAELPAGLEMASLRDERFHLVVATKEAKNHQVLTSFIGSREVDDRATKHFPALSRLRKDVPQAKIVLSSNDLNAHLSMVLQGVGVSILPTFMVQNHLKQKLLQDLYPKEQFKFPLYLVKRRTWRPSRPAQELLRRLETI